MMSFRSSIEITRKFGGVGSSCACAHHDATRQIELTTIAVNNEVDPLGRLNTDAILIFLPAAFGSFKANARSAIEITRGTVLVTDAAPF